MRWCRFLLALIVPAVIAIPAFAGIFSKHNKPNPAERVPQLILAAKTDKSEDKRAAAVHELREYDPNAFPDLIPVLIDVLQHDAKAVVRAEAAQSLGRLRPISQEVGAVLEEAVHDPSFRVRWQARSALMSYRLGGYHSAPKSEAAPPEQLKTQNPSRKWFGLSTKQPVVPVPQTRALAPGETPPPPLAVPITTLSTAPAPAPAASTGNKTPRPLPPLPTTNWTPATSPKASASTSNDAGPDIPPQ